jgi:hypothetical protein
MQFELSFMYLWVSYGHKNQTQVCCTYLKYAINFNEIFPAVSDKLFEQKTERQRNLRTNFNFTFELTVFYYYPYKFRFH